MSPSCTLPILFPWFLIHCLYHHVTILLLLLLSRFSRVRLCATPEKAARQAPPSLGFSRQEHWSGLPFPFPMHESGKWKWSRSVVSDLATRWTVAYQALLSMGFSRQKYWSGVPLPSLWLYYIICISSPLWFYIMFICPHQKISSMRAGIWSRLTLKQTLRVSIRLEYENN